MGLFRSKDREEATEPVVSVKGLLIAGDLDRHDLEQIGVVGESHYQEAISAACGRQGGEAIEFDCIASLNAERTNPYDPNAIMVQVDAHHVGYLSRKDAIRYHPIVDAAERMDIFIGCNARIVAHDPAEAATPNAGVFLYLPTPDGAAESLADYSRETYGS
jgi:hypothetical protein